MANDSSIDEMIGVIQSTLGSRYGIGGGGKRQRSDPDAPGARGGGIKGLQFDDADFEPSSGGGGGAEEEEEEAVDPMVQDEEDEDSGYDMEVAEGDEERDPDTEEGFYDHLRSPQMQSIATRRGWKEIAEASMGARMGGEDEAEDPAERAKRLTVVSASGKPMGQHVPRVKYSLQDAFKKVGGAASIVPPLSGSSGRRSSDESASTSSSSDDEEGEEHTGNESGGEGVGAGEKKQKRARDDDRDETTQTVVGILKRFGANPSEEVLERLKDGERILRRDEQRLERAKKRRRLNPEAEEEASTSLSSESSRKRRKEEKQEREYLRPRYKNSGVEYERFLQTYCPLCGYGDRVNDAIYAPKLAVIREMAEVGVMEGDIGTLAHDLCTVWNEHIYKPMLAEGRRAMQLTYDMCRHHLLKPHRPDPRPMMRRDIEDLTMLIQIVNATIYTENGLTREGSVDSKMVAASINLYKTKYMIAGKRPETMAFYNPNFNFNERAAGGFVNPYQKVHFGGRRITRAGKR